MVYLALILFFLFNAIGCSSRPNNSRAINLDKLTSFNSLQEKNAGVLIYRDQAYDFETIQDYEFVSSQHFKSFPINTEQLTVPALKKKIVFTEKNTSKVLEEQFLLARLDKISKEKKNEKSFYFPRADKSFLKLQLDGKWYYSNLQGKSHQGIPQIEVTSGEWRHSKKTNDKKLLVTGNQVTSEYWCFLSMLYECLNHSSFIQKASEEKTGAMNISLVWNVLPWYGAIYEDMNEQVFLSEALIDYARELPLEKVFTKKLKALVFQGDKKHNFPKLLTRFIVYSLGQSFYIDVNSKDLTLFHIEYVNQGIHFFYHNDDSL